MSGRYRTIVADPPWPFDWNRRELDYKLMTLGELLLLPIVEMAERDAHLFLWMTAEMHREGEGVRLARAWGFDPVGEIIWKKTHFGVGSMPRSQHEPVLVCRRGNLPFTGPRNIGSVQEWAGGKGHSAKPDAFLDLVEMVSPGPYLELFARRARFGWDYWGDESLGTAEMPGEAA